MSLGFIAENPETLRLRVSDFGCHDLVVHSELLCELPSSFPARRSPGRIVLTYSARHAQRRPVQEHASIRWV